MPPAIPEYVNPMQSYAFKIIYIHNLYNISIYQYIYISIYPYTLFLYIRGKFGGLVDKKIPKIEKKITDVLKWRIS